MSSVGSGIGAADGAGVGAVDGTSVGSGIGAADGAGAGAADGDATGDAIGALDGNGAGSDVGAGAGAADGDATGAGVALRESVTQFRGELQKVASGLAPNSDDAIPLFHAKPVSQLRGEPPKGCVCLRRSMA